jgi:hypothetical protein
MTSSSGPGLRGGLHFRAALSETHALRAPSPDTCAEDWSAVMKNVRYKDFTIIVRPIPLKGEGYSVGFDVLKHTGETYYKPFQLRGKFDSEEAATEAAIQFARKAIDEGAVEPAE